MLLNGVGNALSYRPATMRTVRGWPCLVGSYHLPAAPVSDQSRGVALLSYIVVPCPHVLQVIMMSHVHLSCRCFGNTRV
jgi:hypothetical protein